MRETDAVSLALRQVASSQHLATELACLCQTAGVRHFHNATVNVKTFLSQTIEVLKSPSNPHPTLMTADVLIYVLIQVST